MDVDLFRKNMHTCNSGHFLNENKWRNKEIVLPVVSDTSVYSIHSVTQSFKSQILKRHYHCSRHPET